MTRRRQRKRVLNRRNTQTVDQRQHPEKYVPEGDYCYELLSIEDRNPKPPVIHVRVCPFWDHDTSHPRSFNGYCHLLDLGDWEDGGGLLFDQCKSCRINLSPEEDYR